MSCFAPLTAYYSAHKNESGKRSLQFRPQGSLSGSRMQLPCGRCMGCRLEHSRRWAIRMMHEARMHTESCFVTLTYNNQSLPEYGTLVPRDLQLFHKRLNNRVYERTGHGIRYFGCGEYGDLNKRPHYHSIVFGYDFKDKLLYSRNGRDESIFSSRELNDVWPMGECKLGAVTFESCAYVARYVCKKVGGAQREGGHYAVYDSDGVVFERTPEFANMSRRPGIGLRYFEKYGGEIALHDSVIMDCKEVPSTRYYDNQIERLDPDRMVVLKVLRRRKAVWKERQVDRRRVKERLLIARSKQKERKL
nr:MAG: replication initiator protein [Microvirus sp.]